MYMHFQNVSQWSANNGTPEIFKHIEHSKEERIQSVVPKPYCPLACLMPSSAVKTANSLCHIRNETKLGRWVSVYAFINSKFYGKAQIVEGTEAAFVW